MMNDDVLGRALDAMYNYGPEKLYPQRVLPAVNNLDLLCHFGHLDSTGFHVDGQYHSHEEEPEEGVMQIVRGYSRDHRLRLGPSRAAINLRTAGWHPAMDGSLERQ